MAPSPDRAKADGFTKVPNALIDSLAFDDTDKLVYIILRRHAIDDKTDVWPSQVRIAGLARKGRDSVRSSLHKLTEAGIVSEVGRDARNKATYRLHLDVDLSKVHLNQNRQVPDLESPGNLTQNRHQADKADKTNKKDASPRSAGPSLSESEMTSGEDFDCVRSAESAADAEPGPASEIEVNTQAEADIGNAEALPTLSASEGRSNLLQPKRLLTKAEINAAFVTPDGYRVSDDFDDLTYDLNVTLAQTCGEMLNRGDLDLEKLVATQGVERCALWAHWLPRKIADKYAKNPVKGVPSPTGLYINAVRGGWQVDPAWPEFDEHIHTVKAREQSVKRRLDRNLKSATAKLKQDELLMLAEEVRKGQRQLAELSEPLHATVRDEMKRLQTIDDELDALSGDSATCVSATNDNDFDFF
jgi:hypothetical protein